MIAKLKRCPWCNANESLTLDVTATSYSIRCFECQASGPIGMTKQRAIKYWNGDLLVNGDSALIAKRSPNHNHSREYEV